MRMSDWSSDVCSSDLVLGVEHDVVLSPILHDTAGELAQPYEPKDWLKGECEPIPGVTMPNVSLVERNYPETFARFTSLGPALEQFGNGAKGINWEAKREIERSEEHTSELQSLMRISYAVFCLKKKKKKKHNNKK